MPYTLLYYYVYLYTPNGPYSLLVRASYFISYSVYARSTSVISSFANGAGGVGIF